MLAYYFKAQPHLFKDAIKQQLVRLRDERDEREAQQTAADAEKQDSAAPTSSMDMTLYRCAMAQGGCTVTSVRKIAQSKLQIQECDVAMHHSGNILISSQLESLPHIRFVPKIPCICLVEGILHLDPRGLD